MKKSTARTATTPETKKKASDLFDKLLIHMGNLYDRWQDEKEHEDINNYGVAIKKEVEAIGGQFIKMTKRPFGFQYKLDNATYAVSMKSDSYGYNRIA